MADLEHDFNAEGGSLFSEGGDQGFVYWLRCGLAFTLPLLSLGLIALFVWIWHLLTVAPR
jgi:hypothetical protein